jgi:hypothetical protein
LFTLQCLLSIELLHAAFFFWFNQFVQPTGTVAHRSLDSVSIYCYGMQHPVFVASIDLYCLSLHRGLSIPPQPRILHLPQFRLIEFSMPLVFRHSQQLWQPWLLVVPVVSIFRKVFQASPSCYKA